MAENRTEEAHQTSAGCLVPDSAPRRPQACGGLPPRPRVSRRPCHGPAALPGRPDRVLLLEGFPLREGELFLPSPPTPPSSRVLLTIFPRDFVQETEQDVVEPLPLAVPSLLRGAGGLRLSALLLRLPVPLAGIGPGPVPFRLRRAGHPISCLLLAGQDLFDQGQGVVLLAQVLQGRL